MLYIDMRYNNRDVMRNALASDYSLGEIPGNARYRCAEEIGLSGSTVRGDITTRFGTGGLEHGMDLGSLSFDEGDKPADKRYFDDNGNPINPNVQSKDKVKPVEERAEELAFE